MVIAASRRTQVWLVTHSETLADAIRRSGAGSVRRVHKRNGASVIEGLTLFGGYAGEE